MNIKNFLIIFALSLALQTYANAKVLLFTYSYNRPDFIEIQYKTFKKFLKDDHKLIVFNDARDPHLYQQIKATCKRLGIPCIKIPQEIHDQPYLERLPGEYYHAPSIRNCNVVMYSLNNYGFKHDDILVLLDSDMFLIKEFSIREYMKGLDIAALPQSKGPDTQYLWIGLVFMNMKTMPNKTTINFNCGRVNNACVDAGGHTHDYIVNNPNLRLQYFDTVVGQNMLISQEYEDALSKFIQHANNVEFMLDRRFLHYRGGTNWDGKSPDYHAYKTKILHDFIDTIVR